MHNRHQTEEYCGLSKKSGVVEKSKRKGDNQLLTPANANQIQRLRYLPQMMAPLPCSICGHQFVRKIHSRAVLHADEERVEQDKAHRQVVWQSKAPSVRGKAPHIGKVMVQQYYCICFQRPGNYNCATGQFNDTNRKWLKD